MIEQKDLDAGDKHFQLLADGLPQIVWTARPDGWVDYYNQRWYDYTGLTARDTHGWGWGLAVHQDDLDQGIQRWMDTVAKGQVFEMETRLRCKADGRFRWHLIRAVPLRDARGRILKWLGTSTDVDTLKRTQDELRQTQQELLRQAEERSSLLTASNEHLLREMLDRKLTVERLEQTTFRLGEIITTQAMLAQAQFDLERFMHIIVERMLLLTPATAAIVEMVDGEDMVYRAASGHLASFIGMRLKIGNSLSGLCVRNREVLISLDTSQDARVDAEACRRVRAGSMVVAPLFESGQAVGVLKIMAHEAHVFNQDDVQTLQLMAGLMGAALGHQVSYEANRRLLEERTQALQALQEEIEHRTRIEEELRIAEHRTRQIIESSHDSFIGMDEQGLICDWNRAAEQTFGWTRAEVLGRPLAEILIPPELVEAHHLGMERFLKTGRGPVIDTRIELPALRRDGQRIPVEMTISHTRHGKAHLFHAFLRDISDRKRVEEQLLQMAQNDYLTGLPNRSLFEDRLLQAMTRSSRSKRLMAVFYMDIDHFKRINDTHGHVAGDELLKAFAGRLKGSVRASDTLARLGGDEFTLIAEELSAPSDAEKIARTIIDSMAKPFELGGYALAASTSIGISLYAGTPDAAGPQLVQDADSALYEAKRRGRNTYAVFGTAPPV